MSWPAKEGSQIMIPAISPQLTDAENPQSSPPAGEAVASDDATTSHPLAALHSLALWCR
jgi:hypothetical protein